MSSLFSLINEGCDECPAQLFKNISSVFQSRKTYQHVKSWKQLMCNSYMMIKSLIFWKAWWFFPGFLSLQCIILLEFNSEGFTRKELDSICIGKTENQRDSFEVVGSGWTHLALGSSLWHACLYLCACLCSVTLKDAFWHVTLPQCLLCSIQRVW